MMTLHNSGQAGSHEKRAEGQGAAAAGCHQKTLSQTPTRAASRTNTKTGPGNRQEGELLCLVLLIHVQLCEPVLIIM